MKKPHVAAVRTAMQALRVGESRPFFFVIDGDDKLFHVLNKVGKPDAYDTAVEINKVLKAEWADPVATSAKIGAGLISRVGKALYLHALRYTNGANETMLKLVVKEHKTALGLDAAKVEAPPEAPESLDDEARDKLWIDVESLWVAFESSPDEITDEALDALRKNIWTYQKAEGTRDTTDHLKAVAAEQNRRKATATTLDEIEEELEEIRVAFTESFSALSNTDTAEKSLNELSRLRVRLTPFVDALRDLTA